MNLHLIAQEFNTFYDDKRLVLSILSKIRQGKELLPQDAAQITEIEEKWKDDATLYRSIRNELADIKNYFYHRLDHLPHFTPPPAKESFPREFIDIREIREIRNAPKDKKSDEKPNSDLLLPPHSPMYHHLDPMQHPNQQIQTDISGNRTKDLHQFFEAQGIVGEERIRELLVYALIAKANVGIESLAGSGKSAVLQALLKAIPPTRYLTINQGTLASLYHNLAGNNVDYWVIPELQKIFTKDIEEVIKNLTEGASITYSKTNAKRDGIETMSISKKAVLYSLAITNKHLKERDDEFYRRFIIFHTDIRKEQNKNVAARYAQHDFAPDIPHRALEFIPKHLARILETEIEVKNPYLQGLIDSFPAQITGHIRFRSSVKYFQSLVKGHTLFHTPPETLSETLSDIPLHASVRSKKIPYEQGHEQEQKNEQIIFSAFDDNQNIIALYFDIMQSNLLGLTVVDEGLLEVMPNDPLSKDKLIDLFCDRYNSQYDLEESITKLRALNLVDYKNGNYLRKPSARLNLDEEKLFLAADELMKKYYPQHHQAWLNAHSTQKEF